MEDSTHNKDARQRQLPNDILTQLILPCQPVKHLTQYKAVSKQWYSHLSSPHFILKYTKQPLYSHPGPPVRSLFIQSGKSFYLYSCDYDDNVDDLEAASNTEDYLFKIDDYDFDVKNDVIHLVGCSNGLVCLAETLGKYFLLWNPSTNQSHKYYSEVLDISSECHPHIHWGFGFVSSLDDYKVVRTIQYQRRLLVDSVVHVFSLKSNTWKNIEFDLENYSYVLMKRPRLVDEILYWNAIHNPHGKMKVVAFDIARETFYMFPYLAMLSPMGDTLCVMGGRLSKCFVNSQNEWLVHIVEPSTERLDSVRFSCDTGRFDDLIGFTKTGKILVAYSNPKMLGLVELSWVDPSLSSRKSLVMFECQGITRIESYAPSQISPHSPTGMPTVLQQVA